MLSSTSRRAILAGIATAPAVVALTATAAALAVPGPAMPDPIFAAIEAHRKAYDAFREAINRLDELESGLPKHIARNPRTQIGKIIGYGSEPDRPKFVGSHKEIDADYDWLEEHSRKTFNEVNSPVIAKRRAKAHAALDADAAALAKRQEKAGLTAAKELMEATSNATDAAAADLVSIDPTTIEGAAALLRYAFAYKIVGNDFVCIDGEDGDEASGHHWDVWLYRHLADALDNIARDGQTER